MKRKIFINKNGFRSKRISRVAEYILRIGLPLVLLVFFYIFHRTLTVGESERAWLYQSIPEMIEYAVMSLTIIICGAVIADFAARK